MLKGEAPPKGAEPLTKDSLQTVFVHATRGLAAERPTIVLIDDLHFAPEEGRALFASLAMAVPEHRVLLVGTMRPGVPEEWTAGRHAAGARRAAVAVAARPEGPGEAPEGRLPVGATGRGAGLPDRARSPTATPSSPSRSSGGSGRGSSSPSKPDGTWVTTQVIQEIQVPSSVLDLVNARVAELTRRSGTCSTCLLLRVRVRPGARRRGAGHAAAFPRCKRFGQIETTPPPRPVGGPHYVFDHHQVQEALYGGLHEQLREEYHAAIAEALEARAGAADKDPKDLDGALCVDLCEHFLKGAQGEGRCATWTRRSTTGGGLPERPGDRAGRPSLASAGPAVGEGSARAYC